MKKYFQQKVAKLLLLTSMFLGVFSFTSFAGGDTYEIYLNDKLICKQQYKTLTGSTEFHLGKLNTNDRLVIKYNHCGEVGKNRSVIIKDEKGNIIKEWKFTNAQNKESVMVIPVKELLALQTKEASIKLFYSAIQLPEGRMLAAITIDEKTLADNSTKKKS
jgi:hypothetical protein